MYFGKMRSAFLTALLLGSAPALAQTQTVGLFLNTPQAQPGYTIMAPLRNTPTYLLNNDGRPVKMWPNTLTPALLGLLLENGHMIRPARVTSHDPNFGGNDGGGGRIEEYDWDGTLTWSFDYSNAQHLQHHDFKVLPNGNVLFIAWEYKTNAEAIAAGRNPALLTQTTLWPESIVEVQPTPPSGGVIVWQWRVWDHHIQDFDASKANFGVVADHPERIDLNPPQDNGMRDYLHCNGVAYNADLDQIIISSHRYSEMWVIDHSTTTAQAAGSTGGRSGKGGDLLYRWGNPQNYDRGAAADQKLFRQHDAHWIANGLSGAGNILVFNNGAGRIGGNYSSVDQIVPPPVDVNGNYELLPGARYGPASPVWTYTASPPSSWFSSFISGAQRQPNGNTLICGGQQGNLFEVTPAGQIVWRYVNPIRDTGPINQGSPALENLVFKVRRYPPSFPGLVGRTLTPGEPLEGGFTPPPPIPDGAGPTDPVIATRLTAAGDQIHVTWDPNSCLAPNTNLIYGNLAAVSTHTISGSRCAIGTTGTYTWTGVPAGSLFFLLVGRNATGFYESSWGRDTTGAQINGTTASYQCGATTKSTALTCP